MTRPRKEQVSIQDTPYYHIVSRCVGEAISVAKTVQLAKAMSTGANGFTHAIHGIRLCEPAEAVLLCS